jgi:Uma2 family endonuclease
MHMLASKRQWTVDDLQGLPDDGQRYEIIDGELFVTSAPSSMHQRALGVLYRLIADYLDRERVGYVYFAPADVIFSPKRAVQPDLFVTPAVDGRAPRSYAEMKGLTLAVEVLSPSTARLDRVVKRALYRDEGVPEFWVVDMDARTIEKSTPNDLRVDVFDERIEWMPEGASVPLVIDVGAYFTEVLER